MTTSALGLPGGYSSRNAIQLVMGGGAYFKLLEDLIEQAQESIHLQVYIYEDDDTGTRITNALIRAAQRGVTVYMLLDGYASSALSSETISTIKEAGIHFRWFEPLFKSRKFYVGRRMHHKVFVADGLHSLVSGRNISDRYNDLPNQPGWLDWAVYVQGETSTELYNRCVQMWFRGKRKVMLSASREPYVEGSACSIRVRINDWVLNKNQVSRSYLEMFQRAQSKITIMSSYFLPGRVFRKNLRQATKRGVGVRIILTKESDVKLAKLAERFFYPWLLRRGIEVYEYRKKIVHGKIATYDEHWVTVGSFNFNDLSAYASIELNLDVNNQEFSKQVDLVLEEIIQKGCDRITEEDLVHKTNLLNRLTYRLAYALIRLIFFIFMFNFKQEKGS